MNTQLHRTLKDESGITALETAIILIAFVVVAAIFAFTVLSTGTFLTEKSKEASYAGLQEVRGSLALRGSLVISGTLNSASHIVFTLGPVAGGTAVDVSKITMTYRDTGTNENIAWSSSAAVANSATFSVTDPDGNALTNNILQQGKLAQFTVAPTNSLDKSYFTFALEIKPPTGGVLLIERTTPAQIDTVTDLK